MTIDPRLKDTVAEQPHPLLFVTISGAHLYGFPSADSDYDLRGAHILPAGEVMGLSPPRETITLSQAPAAEGDLELDLVTHDVKKFMRLMLKRNGQVLEQLYSPLVVHTTAEHEELKAMGRNCITRHHGHHYLGVSRAQWKRFHSTDPPRVKLLLYVCRLLLTGIHLMRTGEIEANLVRLNEQFELSYVDDLIARKAEGGERCLLTAANTDMYDGEYQRMTDELEQAMAKSHLPEAATAKDALNGLLLRTRRMGL